jgi:hypothetical protein
MYKSDEELVRDYVNGDEEAFTSLIKKHPKLWNNHIKFSVGTDNDSFTDRNERKADYRQELYLSLHTACMTYDPEKAKFLTHLVNCMRRDFSKKVRLPNSRKKRTGVIINLDSFSRRGNLSKTELSKLEDHNSSILYNLAEIDLSKDFNVTEQYIIRLRSEGYEFKEISSMLELNNERLGKIYKHLILRLS